MKLNIDDDRSIENPTPAQVQAAIDALQSEEFLILTASDERYIQVYAQEDGTYQLEYRDGSDERHFGVDPEAIDRSDVADAFSRFLRQSPDLTTGWDWQPLEFEEVDEDEDDDDETRVEFNGVMVAEGWPEQVEAAQELTTITIEGTPFERIPYGRERGWPMPAESPCGDCAVAVGQYHVPGCDIEECPRCHGQLITCECEVEDDGDADADDFEEDDASV